MFEIEPNVPVPATVRQVTPRYPFAEMAINDSFLVEDEAIWGRVQAAASYYKRRTPGWGFASRKTAAGLRVWRIE